MPPAKFRNSDPRKCDFQRFEGLLVTFNKQFKAHFSMQSFILRNCDCQTWMMIIPKMLNINVERNSGKNRKP